jgi:AcrR family transcriptional regulator
VTTKADAVADSSVRRRTRRAIIEAAVHVWARDFSAPLSAVAAEAGVSRSTLHRYFVDRSAVVDACLAAAHESFDTVGAENRPVSDGVESAMDRLIADLEHVLPLSNWVIFLWSDPSRFGDHPAAAGLLGDDGTEPTRELIRQGQAAGDLDPDAPTDWLLELYYSVLYCAAEGIVNGRFSIAEASRLAARALRRGIAPA